MKYDSTDAVISHGLNDTRSTEDMVEELLDEQMTAGIKNVLCKLITPKFQCPWCGFPIPKYPGRYPTKCPECSSLLEPNDSNNTGE